MNTVSYTTKAARTTVITGEVSCGKTEALVDAIVELLHAGEQADRIGVACASPNAACSFKKRLAAKAGDASDGVRVQTAQAYALAVLGAPEARAFTGRQPRILSQFEVSFVMEDMKTSGLRPRRLKEMLKFFYRTWTELGNFEDDWLLKGEETYVHTLLKDTLGMVRGIMEPELSNFAVRFLIECPDEAAAWALPHVFVDDYTNLSKASQILMGLLAQESLTIAGNPRESILTFESYPYEEGLACFIKDNPSCTSRTLRECHHSRAVHAAARNLLAEEEIKGEGSKGEELPSCEVACDSAEGSVCFQEYARPADEFVGVSELVCTSLAQGLAPEEVFIAVPNRAWSRAVAEQLKEEGIAAHALPLSQPLGGDVRNRERSGAALLFTGLRLIADPDDAVAWRAWCGFGDYLTHSNSFLKLREVMEERELTLPEALAYAVSLSTIEEDLAKLLPAYEFSLRLIEALRAESGPSLVERLAEWVEATDAEKAAVLALCEAAEGECAAALVKRAEQNLLAPVFRPNCVRIGFLEQLCGLTPKLLIFSGFVDGFVPCRAYFDRAEMPLDKQEQEHKRLVRLLYTTLSKTQRDLVCTYFTKTDLESAEMMKLALKRIRMEDGVRIARIGESIFGAVMRGEK